MHVKEIHIYSFPLCKINEYIVIIDFKEERVKSSKAGQVKDGDTSKSRILK